MVALSKLFRSGTNILESETSTSLYDIPLTGINGETIDLNEFRGKKILFVNVASKCAFTPQYMGLQNLQDIFGDKLVVIGLPCNQFAEQEPGTEDEIQKFCQANFGIRFIMTEKVDVKGENQHPIYAWLTNEELNGVKGSRVLWNFQKYLVDEEGNLLDSFNSFTKPLSKKITQYLS